MTRSRLQLELAYALHDGVVRHSRGGNCQRRDRSADWDTRRPGKKRRGSQLDQTLPPRRSSPVPPESTGRYSRSDDWAPSAARRVANRA